jgi:hypothetical protein
MVITLSKVPADYAGPLHSTPEPYVVNLPDKSALMQIVPLFPSPTTAFPAAFVITR